MNNLLFVLGASDPEMAMIEQLLVECGVPFAYATKDGKRVHPGNMYDADPIHITSSIDMVLLVECDAPLDTEEVGVTRCDHHRPGDPGFGLPPERFIDASSIGQVLAALGLDVVRDLDQKDLARWKWHSYDARYNPEMDPAQVLLVAAADHCLRAAYAGQCPGVDPDELMRWRAESRAKFQGRHVSDVLRDITLAAERVLAAPFVTLRQAPYQGFDRPFVPAITVRDMRTAAPQIDGRGAAVPELPEAALRLGESYLAGPLLTPDGRRKIVVSGTAEEILAFRDHWAPANGLTGVYAMPDRGMGGGYR